MAILILAALALSIASQPAETPAGLSRLNCRAVTVTGATLDFPLETRGPAETGEARILGGDAPFVRVSNRLFRSGGSPNSIFFRILPDSRNRGWTEIELFLDQGGAAGFPIAIGHCTAAAFAASPAQRASFSDLTDAMLVRSANAAGPAPPCSILTLEGRVSQARERLEPHESRYEIVFEPLDELIWRGGARSIPRDPLPPSPSPGAVPIVQSAIFHSPDGSGGPTGLETVYFDQPRLLAVKILDFVSVGNDAVARGPVAFGICPIHIRGGQ